MNKLKLENHIKKKQKIFIDKNRENNWLFQYFVLEKNIAKCKLCIREYKNLSSTLRTHLLSRQS